MIVEDIHEKPKTKSKKTKKPTKTPMKLVPKEDNLVKEFDNKLPS